MKTTAFIRKTAKKNDTDSVATIYFRLRDGQKDIKAASELSISPNHWSAEKQGYKDRVALVADEVKQKLNSDIANIITTINQTYTTDATSEWLSQTIEKYHHPNRFKTAEEIAAETKLRLIPLFEEFLQKHPLSDVRKKNYKVVMRGLARYELYVQATRKNQRNFALLIDDVTSDTLRDIWDFFKNEHLYFEQYPHIYDSIPEKRTPQPRGKNTLLDCFTRIRTFFYWCNSTKKTTNRPFDEFPIEECTYGTPYYITLEERDQICNANFSSFPELAIQRDIFIFHSLIGCRVSDLYRFTKQNIINGAIEYIARKTRDGNPVTIRVPLNDKAKTILKRYEGYPDTLLPFIREQEYNRFIKMIFREAGIDRIVTILDPLTNEGVKRPLYEIASSHIARRTFIGNIYKQVKDPNLVGSLSGHKEGSKAFARYREIDEEIKKELVNLLS